MTKVSAKCVPTLLTEEQEHDSICAETVYDAFKLSPRRSWWFCFC